LVYIFCFAYVGNCTSFFVCVFLATVLLWCYRDDNSVRREITGKAETKARIVVTYALLSVNIVFIKEIAIFRK